MSRRAGTTARSVFNKSRKNTHALETQKQFGACRERLRRESTLSFTRTVRVTRAQIGSLLICRFSLYVLHSLDPIRICICVRTNIFDLLREKHFELPHIHNWRRTPTFLPVRVYANTAGRFVCNKANKGAEFKTRGLFILVNKLPPNCHLRVKFDEPFLTLK
jgi:hypothetical protein